MKTLHGLPIAILFAASFLLFAFNCLISNIIGVLLIVISAFLSFVENGQQYAKDKRSPSEIIGGFIEREAKTRKNLSRGIGKDDTNGL